VAWDSVTADATIASLGFDSLTVLDLLYDVQQEFGIEIEAEQIVSVRTVGQFVEFLRGKVQA
jgi:acyl carrier protein